MFNELQIKDLLEEIKASKDEGYISGELSALRESDIIRTNCTPLSINSEHGIVLGYRRIGLQSRQKRSVSLNL